jgi:hypothetical protein
MPRHSDDATHEVWRKRFRRFAKSGLPVVRFCARERISVASFYNWRKKVNSNGFRRRASGRRTAFQPVQVVPASPGVSIHLPCGTRIEMRAEDLDAIRVVVGEVARGERGPQRDDVSC